MAVKVGSVGGLHAPDNADSVLKDAVLLCYLRKQKHRLMACRFAAIVERLRPPFSRIFAEVYLEVEAKAGRLTTRGNFCRSGCPSVQGFEVRSGNGEHSFIIILILLTLISQVSNIDRSVLRRKKRSTRLAFVFSCSCLYLLIKADRPNVFYSRRLQRFKTEGLDPV